jgi:hypothetical protein
MIVEDEGLTAMNTSFNNIRVLADTSHDSMAMCNAFINQHYEELKDPRKYT